MNNRIVQNNVRRQQFLRHLGIVWSSVVNRLPKWFFAPEANPPMEALKPGATEWEFENYKRDFDLRKTFHDETSKAIRRIFFLLIGSCLFCIVTLAGLADSQLLTPEVTVKLPILNYDIGFPAFLVIGSAIVITLTIYLHIYVGQHRVQPLASGSCHPMLPNFDDWTARLMVSVTFYWVVPITLAAFAWKAWPHPYGRTFLFITILVTTGLVFLQIRRCPRKSRVYGLPLLIAAGIVFIQQLLTVTTARQLYLANANLSNKNIQGINLSNALLTKANLSKASLSKTILSKADLSGANLSEANLTKTNLSGANLSGANLSGAILSEAILTGTNLSGANLAGATLTGTNLSRANLYKAILSKAKLVGGADLSGAYLFQADLSGANMTRVNMSGAYLYEANLSKTNLYAANLSKANLHSANLYGAYLHWANLSKAQLVGRTNLSKAYMSGANLSGADLSGARLFGTYLLGTNIMQIQLAKACSDEETSLPNGTFFISCTKNQKNTDTKGL